MQKKYPRTNIYVIDQEKWHWAQYRAKRVGYRSVSEYLFKSIELDKENPDVSAIIDGMKVENPRR